MEPTGLRERKRLRTREAIARAALEMFDRQGFAATTIPQIAEAAEVSPRTVSSYFPQKEELAFPDGEEAYRSLEARLQERLPDETAADALRAWIADWVHAEADRREELVVRRRIVAADESLQAYEHRFHQRAQHMVAEAIARDLGALSSDLEPRMAAAATMTIFELLGEALEPADCAAELPPADVLAVVDRALLFIGAGIRALRGGA
jgi:AcrR family transcriptional regulator